MKTESKHASQWSQYHINLFFTEVKKFKYDSSYLKQKQIMENDLSYWESIRD